MEVTGSDNECIGTIFADVFTLWTIAVFVPAARGHPPSLTLEAELVLHGPRNRYG